MRHILMGIAISLLVLGTAYAEDGVTAKQVRVGTVLALKGPAQGLGHGMLDGMEAAFKGASAQGHSIDLRSGNDFYEPSKAVEETNRLINDGIFAMIGNVGTPTAAAILPILKDHNVPAIGFFTGAGILRPGAGGPVVNYRASYIQETVGVIEQALHAGIPIDGVCAFVQNDAFGMAGLAGVKKAIESNGGDPAVVTALDGILKATGDTPDRNEKGPVGVYTRNTIEVRPGYGSLKAWEKKSGKKCRLVVTVGAYGPIAHFARVSRQSKDRWMISAVSFTGADNLLSDLKKYHATDRVIMTQVVPLPDSNLPIVKEAKSKLGKNFGFVSLEGYIVGKMFLHILADTQGDLTRANFMAAVKSSKFDLGGVPIDFTKNGYQGSDLVVYSYVTPKGFKEMNDAEWKAMQK